MTKAEAMEIVKPTMGSAEAALLAYELFRKEKEVAKSDLGYWDAESKCVQALMEAVVLGAEEGEELPDLDTSVGMLMDVQGRGIEWCAQAIADHEHVFEWCQHEEIPEFMTRTSGVQPRCGRTLDPWSNALSHWVCTVCGRDRYDEKSLVDALRRRL